MSQFNAMIPPTPNYIYRAMIMVKHGNKQRSQKLVAGIPAAFKFLSRFTFEKIENATIQWYPRSSNTYHLYRAF